MTIQQLCSIIAKNESKKTQVSIGNIREVVAVLSDLMVEDILVIRALIVNGMKRQKKNKACQSEKI